MRTGGQEFVLARAESQEFVLEGAGSQESGQRLEHGALKY